MKLTRKTSFLLVGALCGGMWFWWHSKPGAVPILVDQLSPRAEEFITTQRSDGTGLWNGVDLETPVASAPTQTSLDTECFSAELPLRTANPKVTFAGTRCSWRAKIIEPLGYITLASYPTTEFENDSGIVLRRRSPEQYSAETLEIPNYSQTLVFRSDTEVMVFALQQQRMVTLAVTDVAKPSAVSTAQITVILSSLKLKPLPETPLTLTP